MVVSAQQQTTIKLACYGPLEPICGAERVLNVAGFPVSVAEALEQLAGEVPEVRPHLKSTACAVGDALVSRSHALSPGETLVLIPPVSGG